VVLVDNGRSRILGSEFRDMLRCIRCGACLNHCPVYGAIGGHAYGWVYPGPMGSVLTPLILGLEEAGDLPNACSLNGRCEQVCPVKIPLPKLIRALRHQQFERKFNTERARLSLRLWLFLAKRPHLYHPLSRLAIRILSTVGRRNGYLSKVPLTGSWTRSRNLPAPQGDTFRAAWRRHTRHGKVLLER
jgi:L-lactate dehydrogenase complex protein LldF